MGLVHQRSSEWTSALRFHQLDQQISQEMGDVAGRGRALANMGETYEAMEDRSEKAMECFENLLQVATDADDAGLKTKAFENLGMKYFPYLS